MMNTASKMPIRGWLVTMSCVATFMTLPDSVRTQEARPPAAVSANEMGASPLEVTIPEGFVIGPDDVLSIIFWRDKEMSTQVTVRPDGMISLPLLNEIQAAGLTPADLRARVAADSKQFFANPNVTVVVNQINSRKVFITGQIVKPGPYALTAPTTVLQLISMAGGLKDFADSKKILIVRHENGRTASYPFNYKQIGRNLRQNIELKPGDTVVVP
jgi:polysaccharide export outer membrane protein